MFGKNAWSLLFLWVAIIGVMTVATSASGPTEMGEHQTYLPVLHRAPSAPVSIALAIAADDRDGYENQDFYLSGDINENNWVGLDSVTTGWIFDNVAIPAGAIITDAYIQVRGFGNNSSATIRIHAFAEDSAPPFVASGANKPGTRPLSSTFVDWPNAWPFMWQSFTTPDLSPIIQEVIDRPGWSSGNNLGFHVSAFGTGTKWVLAVPDYAAGPYTEEDYDGHSVILHVTYVR